MRLCRRRRFCGRSSDWRLLGLDGIDDQVSVLCSTESGAQALLASVWHDLLDRLAFDVITLPPLREREGDILVLICRGPMGSGMEEAFQLTIALRHLSFGKHIALLQNMGDDLLLVRAEFPETEYPMEHIVR